MDCLGNYVQNNGGQVTTTFIKSLNFYRCSQDGIYSNHFQKLCIMKKITRRFAFTLSAFLLLFGIKAQTEGINQSGS